ncbi:MAG TPA: globin domain-containing protein [Streptosporangiaceae bacterium]|nr:globin domain-containing protein [Streptosporangiaceae bacterium]
MTESENTTALRSEQASLGNSDQQALKTSFARVGETGEKAVAYFYGQLFAAHPHLRALFPASMDYQRDRLMRALVRITESLSNQGALDEYLAQLGRDHRKYGVRDEHYPAVGQALLATLAKFAGDAWTPAAADAWLATYQHAAAVMTTAAGEAAADTPPWWRAEVVQHDRRRRNLAIVTVQPDSAVPYQAGQHLSVQTPRWHRVWRRYSVANAPREDGRIQFHIRAVAGGWVSTSLVQHTKPGDPLILGPAAGTMTAPPPSTQPMLCAAGGTGLAPIKAIVEETIRGAPRSDRRPVQLYVGARIADDLYDMVDLWSLQECHPWLDIITAVEERLGDSPGRGLVHEVIARKAPLADLPDAFLAGPPAMVERTLQVLTTAGLPGARIRHDLVALKAPSSLRELSGESHGCPR